MCTRPLLSDCIRKLILRQWLASTTRRFEAIFWCSSLEKTRSKRAKSGFSSKASLVVCATDSSGLWLCFRFSGLFIPQLSKSPLRRAEKSVPRDFARLSKSHSSDGDGRNKPQHRRRDVRHRFGLRNDSNVAILDCGDAVDTTRKSTSTRRSFSRSRE